jgi:hypothetical protein
MSIIYPASSFNPASLQADGAYIAIQNPPGITTGVATDVFGVVGTASWGPINTAVHMGTPFDAAAAWGPVGAPALTDPYDLATDLSIAFSQASSQASLEGFAVRVTDGTDTAATSVISGAATSASETVTVGGTAHTGDNCNVIFTSSAVAGSPLTVTYVAKSTDTLATIAAGIAAAINANAVLAALSVYATVALDVVSVYQPTALSPQITFTESVTGGGATTTLTLSTGAAATGGATVAGIYTGSLGNQLVQIVQPGAGVNTWNYVLSLPILGINEIFTNIPTAGFWTALKTALASGQSGDRGPSQLGRATLTNTAVGAPTAGTYTFSGGTDGRAGVTTAILQGSDTAVPKTGLYALRSLKPALGLTWIVGSTDRANDTAMKAFADSEGPEVLLTLPTGTTTAAGITAVQTAGVAGPEVTYVKDWVYWFDAQNNITRLVPPTAFIGGMACTTAPQTNPGNEEINGVQGTERTNPLYGTSQPYSLSEIGQLAQVGIMIITNPIPQGSVWGTPHGQTTSLNGATKGMEWWRTTIFLARSLDSKQGQYVDMNQSQQPNDPLRNQIKKSMNSFLQSITSSNGNLSVIDSYAFICNFSSSPSAVPGNGINTPASVQAGFLYWLAKCTYLGTARFIVGYLQGGVTVVSVGASAAGQAPA